MNSASATHNTPRIPFSCAEFATQNWIHDRYEKYATPSPAAWYPKMPPFNRQRKKRTIYLTEADEAAVECIRKEMSLRTKASAIRYALHEVERRLSHDPNSPALIELLKLVESPQLLLCDRDKDAIHRLCYQVRRDLKSVL